MKKRLILFFVILIISLFIISGCESIKGSRIDRANIDNVNYRENAERELVEDREYFLENNLISREFQENIEFVQTPFESELGIEQPKYYGYIIEFEDKPLIERKTELENAQARRDEDINSQLNDYYDELVNSHNEIKSSFSNKITNFDNKIKGEYYKTFNGISLDISEEELNGIRSLPNVKNVYPNYEVKINAERERLFIDEKVPIDDNPYDWHLDITNVQDVWNLGYTGEGVTIAVIDTGIDSSHRDLRGKVIEEHCFSESNECPNGENEQHGRGAGMDDNGHGTHVAGIVAGNLFGVAPDANLVSIKVLSSEGSGYLSDIIKGIETVVDPNNDNNFEDHYDIISMSLSGYDGTPDDPDAIAVDNAVNLGVVAVIAVGNLGSRYGTVGCPGCARKVITVGATDSEDEVAYFSSRGPTSTGTIKPNIVAPGVLICSSRLPNFNPWEFNRNYQLCYDNEHVLLSGTSMATPLVSGAVALIKQAHPDWSPDEIKMSLRDTAVDLDENVLTQGYGRVNILESVNLEYAPPNIEITNPLYYDILRAGDVIEIEGSILNNGLENYEIEWGRGENPDEWSTEGVRLINDGRNNIDSGVLGYWNTISINEPNIYTIRLKVNINRNSFYEYKTIYLDPTLKEGWPRRISEDRCEFERCGLGYMEPVVKDINNDGFDEIIVYAGGNPPKLYVFNYNGNLANNWPQEVGDVEMPGKYLTIPTVGDINNDGFDEIIVISPERDFTFFNLYVFDYNGNILWSTRMEYSGFYPNTLVLEDLNLDGNKEIIIKKQGSMINPTIIIIINNEGNLVYEWGLDTISFLTNSPPAVGNLDDDPELEIAVTVPIELYRSVIHIYDINGSEIGGWPRYVTGVTTSISIGDINNDGNLEIIVGSASLRRDDRENVGVYIFDKNGNILNGWPFVGEEGFIYDTYGSLSTPSLVNFNEDNNLGIVISVANSFSTYILDYEDNIIRGWPKNTVGYSYFHFIGDINGDNIQDVLTKNMDYSKVLEGKIYAWNYNGEALSDFPKIVESYYLGGKSLNIKDIDGNGRVELITTNPSYKHKGTIYVWDLYGRYNPQKMDWSEIYHDSQHTGRYEPIKYPFSCDGEYFRTWHDEGEIIRQEEYNILEDQCEGFRCLSNNNEISPSCYNEQRCNEVCTGSNLCLDIDEWQGICEEQREEEPERRQPVCGNGIKEGREECDGDDWGRIRNCEDLGYDGGRLSCNPVDVLREDRCKFNTGLCYYNENGGKIPKEQAMLPGIGEEVTQEPEIPSQQLEAEEVQPIMPETQPVIEDINLKYLITDNQVILEWNNIINENNEISARSVIEITGNTIKEGNFFSNIINAIKSLFKPKVRGIKLEDNIYKIYKSTDVNNPKQELIVEGSKENFNCDINCKYIYVEDVEGIYYYSVEINGKVFSVGPVEVKKEEDKDINIITKPSKRLEVD